MMKMVVALLMRTLTIAMWVLANKSKSVFTWSPYHRLRTLVMVRLMLCVLIVLYRATGIRVQAQGPRKDRAVNRERSVSGRVRARHARGTRRVRPWLRR